MMTRTTICVAFTMALFVTANFNTRQLLADEPTEGDHARTAEAMTRAYQIRLPKVELQDATLEDAVRYIHEQSVKHSRDGKGLNIILDLQRKETDVIVPPALDDELRECIYLLGQNQRPYYLGPCSSPKTNQPINLSLQNVTVMEAIQQIAASVCVSFWFAPEGVKLGNSPEQFAARVYTVPPNVEDLSPLNDLKSLEQLKTNAVVYSKTFVGRFPLPIRSYFFSKRHLLVIVNTAENLEHIDKLAVRELGFKPYKPNKDKPTK